MNTRLRIAIASERRYSAPNAPWLDDARLAALLEDAGCEVFIVDWQTMRERSTLDVTTCDAVFVSSTWTIPDAPLAFLEWLAWCERDGRARLVNSRDVLELGIHKNRYLTLLDTALGKHGADAGSLTPTAFLFADRATPGETSPDETSSSVMSSNESPDRFERRWRALEKAVQTTPGLAGVPLVIKPIISADGRNTHVWTPGGVTPPRAETDADHRLDDMHAARAALSAILDRPELQGAMAQPYLSGIEQGEYSLTVIGTTEWCVRKPGGFRADDFHERTLVPMRDVPPGILALKDAVLAVLHERFAEDELTRLRIDVIEQDGRAMLLELELVEPNLNAQILGRADPEAATRGMKALADRLLARARVLSAGIPAAGTTDG